MKAASSYVKCGRLKVQGWLSRGACDMIMRVADAQLQHHVTGNVAEIGVHHGRLFILLRLLTRSDEKAVAIDLFEDQQSNVDRSGEGDYGKLMANIARHVGTTERTVVHKGDSTKLTGDVVKQIAGGPIRLFSVDGGHTEQITKHDLETAQQSLAKGGVVILDDCFNGGWPGVVSGALRFLDTMPSICPFAIGANKTLFATREYCPVYSAALNVASAKITTHDFLGHEVLCLDYETSPGVILWLRQTDWWKHVKDTRQGQRLKRFYTKLLTLRRRT
jgi:hypothetical protein